MSDNTTRWPDREYPLRVVPPQTADEGFFSFHPDLPGCMSSGRTAAEAIENLSTARELWIEARLEIGGPVPEPGSAARKV